MNQIGLMKVYLKLTNLQKNVPRASEVKEKYVREYNASLDLLAQASGKNLDGFRVPESEIHRKLLTFTIDPDTEECEEDYAPDLYCDRAILMKKLGTILKFFNVISIQGKPHIDFNLPDE